MRAKRWVTVIGAVCLLAVWSGVALAVSWDKQEHYINLTGQAAFDLTKILWSDVPVTNAITSQTDTNCFKHYEVMTFGIFTIIHWYDPVLAHGILPGSKAYACFSRAGRLPIYVLGAWWTDTSGHFIGWCGPNLAQYPQLLDNGNLIFNLEHRATNWTGTQYPPLPGDTYGTPRGPVTVTEAYFANTHATTYSLNQLTEDLFTDPGITWVALPSLATLNYQDKRTWTLGTSGAFNPGDNILVRFKLTGDGIQTVDIAQFKNEGWNLTPALPWWGMTLLGMLLLAAGAVLVLRKRRPDMAAA